MNNDTITLLKACNSGCKNATDSMEQVMGLLDDQKLKTLIRDFNDRHIKIGDECHQLLNDCGYDEKDPSPMAKVMSFISTEVKMLGTDNDTKKAAEIMMDGCNMGIKTVSACMNEHSLASSESRALAEKLIALEQQFIDELKNFL